jgi:hypothetical protein
MTNHREGDKWLIMGHGTRAYKPSFMRTGDDGLGWTKHYLEATLFDSYREALEFRQVMPRSKWIRNITVVRLADVPDKPS